MAPRVVPLRLLSMVVKRVVVMAVWDAATVWLPASSMDQVKEGAAKDGLYSALITFPVHPRQVIQTNPRIVRKRCDEPGLSGLIASLNFNPRIVRKRCDV